MTRNGPAGGPGPGLDLPAPRGLYVHFPFCPHRCHYCDYAVRASPRPPIDDWLESVSAELDAWVSRPEWPRRPRVETIYVGGGTPSMMGGAGLEELAGRLRGRLRWSREGVEWTVEANPESLDAGTARRWRRSGVNRLTLGVQSYRRRALDWLGRLHGPGDAVRALEAAREAGFSSVDADLVYGLPPEAGGPGSAGDARRLAEQEVEHVSLYELDAAAGTPLGRWVAREAVDLPGEGASARAYLELSRLLEDAGYDHYEVSHLALPGHASRHNRAYWDGTPYLGLGPSAHSWLPPVRVWNERGWVAYRNAVREGLVPTAEAERPGEGERRLERIWLSLRQRSGLPAGDPLLERIERAAGAELRRWEDRGWMRRTGGGLSVTPRGWIRLDELISVLAVRLEGAEVP